MDQTKTPASEDQHHLTWCAAVGANYPTCRWCAEPTSGIDVCRHCRHHRRIPGTANVLAPLIYAIAGTGSAALLRDYKDHPSGAVRRRHGDEIASLLRTALTLHEGCLARAVGMPVDVRTTIPSLTFRPGPHPFAELARDVTETMPDLLMPRAVADCHRVVSLGKFSVSRTDVIEGRHVLVLDDIWTTGANAQSASMALRAAGAAAVSVLVIGRWLNPSYPPTKAFLVRPPTPFDPRLCPVNGVCGAAESDAATLPDQVTASRRRR